MSQANLSESKETPRPGVDMQKRDAETYIALGLFILAVGIPVVLGTYWALKPTSSVSIIVSRGALACMPKLIGLTEKEAQKAVEDAGLKVGKEAEVYHASVPKGKVAVQETAEGASLEPESEVNFSISNGPAFKVDVPNLAHQERDIAQKKLGFKHLTAGAVSEEFSPDVAEGKVIRQNPAAYTKVDSGTPIDLVISKGQSMVTVPSAIGMSQEDAKKVVEAAGLLRGPINTVSSATAAAGIVISQNPEPGKEHAAGRAVQFIVSSGPKTTTVPSVPDVVAKPEDQAKQQFTQANLALADVKKVFSKDIPAGQVISQFPAGGSYLEPHVRAATVNLACSITLLLIGIASIAYGKILLNKHKKRQ